MKVSQLLVLPATLVAAVFTAGTSSAYSEHLSLQPLAQRYLYAGFNFTATTPLSQYYAQHYRYFPRSLAQILQYSHTKELHLRFALGRWDEESWGARPRNGAREGGTGVEIWAWVDGSAGEVEQRWNTLVNSLSGLFCASLNFIDSTRTTRPVLSFVMEGTEDDDRDGRLQLLHGTLPHEVVCTENLTPFLKLLPCKGKRGISSLLDGHKVFDANWQTMSIDVRPICVEGRECELEIQQTVDLVLDIERSMRPRDSPIPRPQPIEQIECDDSKPYNGEDTCYPKTSDGEMAWSLSKIFGTVVRGSCHLDDGADANDISLQVPSERHVNVSAPLQPKEARSPDGRARLYRLPDTGIFDLSLPHQVVSERTPLQQPPLFATRQMTGYGQERGGMHATLHNPLPYPQRVIYLESLPWFLRPYMHTLLVSGARTEKMYYTPAIDRQRGTQLELLLDIPAHSTVDITYDFEKAILRYTEYPPDANRGFDVAPAVVRILPSNGSNDRLGSYLRTTSLLLPLPTPDFSMPYNVIILTSTVIALGFGSIFNLLTRRFVLVEEIPANPLAARVKQTAQRMGGIVSEHLKRLRKSFESTEKKLPNGDVGTKANGDLEGPESKRPMVTASTVRS